MLLVAALSTTARAAETGTLTLACKGTTVEGYEGAEPNPTSMRLIVNFTAATVQGFDTPDLLGVPVKITGIDDVSIAFGGTGRPFGDKWSISGNIDRVTGEVKAAQTETDMTGKTFSSTAYSLKCRPTQ
jgi:hypothetical protein